VEQVVKHLVTTPDGTYVDGTAGSGGHSLAIGTALTDKGRLICLDRDPDAVRLSRQRLAILGKRVLVAQANFSEFDKVLEELGITRVEGVLLDLGMSSYQLEKSGRGFSFGREEPLDMRMDPKNPVTACHLVNDLSGRELESILRDYGEERRARSISKAIIQTRKREPIETSQRLAELIREVYPPALRFRARHPATRTFQALRIAVNAELENLDTFLQKIPAMLIKGGRLVVLSYHSLEDRRVKQAMVNWEQRCTCPPDFPDCACGKVSSFRRVFKKGLKAGQGEVEENPRARSAILRAAERIQP